MSLNWKEIDAVLAELALEGSHIQKVRQPDFTSLVLDLYRPGFRHSLLISLEQGRTRLHTLSQDVSSPKVLQRFAQLLRSRIQGGRITECCQVGQDRIVKMVVVRAGETTRIWVRLWGGAANIVATDETHTVLDAFYRRPNRNEVSGEPFNPEQDELPPKKSNREFEIRDFPGDGTMSARIERAYNREIEEQELQSLRERVERELAREEARLFAAVERLEQEREAAQSPEELRQLGDIIMSNIHRIERGSTVLRAENFFRDNDAVEIELDPTVSPGENAERYYGKYKRRKGRLEHLDEELRNVRTSLERLRARRSSAQGETDPEALRAIRTSTPKPKRSSEPDQRIPGLRFASKGFTILVGRTAAENDELLRRHVRGNDYWLHTRDQPGGYVFIRSVPGKSVPLDVLLDAGNLAVHYSKARNAAQADLYYTQVKYLRRARNGKPGLVIPTQEKNLSVRVERSRIERLHSPNE